MIKKISTGLILFLVFTITFMHIQNSAQAVTASDWRPGRIIDDSIFTNKNDMSVDQIQAFLNTQVGTGGYGRVAGQCDYYGVGTSEYGGGTRAQYGAANNNPAPFTCLKDYYEIPKVTPGPGIPASNYGGAPIPSGARSAAQLIWDAAQRYSINPKVLLVTIQKESRGPLTTDDWPFKSQYTYAMGAHCPDSGPNGSANCDSNYAGFSIQISESAALFRYYLDNMNQPWWPYKHLGINSVLYNPNASCGSSNINIETMSTAALYTYTPYQPNQAALNNMYGSGDSCSAYGNRNFWRIYNDWFGSPNGTTPTSYNLRLIGPITTSPVNPIGNQPVTFTYTIKNYGSQDAAVQSSVLQCRLNTWYNCDPNWDTGFTISAGAQRTMNVTMQSLEGGSYVFSPYFLQNNTWSRYGSQNGTDSVLAFNVPDVRLVTPITTNPANPIAGEGPMVSYTAQNYGSLPVIFQSAVLQCRLNTVTNCDSPYSSSFTLNPGERRTFNNTLAAMAEGSYSLVPYYMQNGTWYQFGPGYIGANSMQYYAPDLRIVNSSIAPNPAGPVPGQTLNVSYTIRNYGSQSVTTQASILQCRFNTNTSCDPAYDAPTTLAANGQITLSSNIPSVKAGSYMLKPYFMLNNRWYYYGNDINYLKLDVPPYVADTRIDGIITTNPASPIPGQPLTINYTVKNFGDKPAIYQSSILQCRFNTNTNCDPAYDTPVNLAPGASQSFSINFPAVRAGIYTFTPFYLQNDVWHKQGGLNNSLRLDVPAYVADLRLTSPISVLPNNPTNGQSFTVTYTVQNFSSQSGILQNSVLQCRYNNSNNCDPSWNGASTINSGDSRTFTENFIAKSGSYSFKPYYLQNDVWHLTAAGSAPSNTLQLNIP